MQNKIFLAFILLTFSTLFWSGNFLVAKLAYNSSLPPLKLSFFRWLIAFLIIFPFSYKSIFKNISLIKDNLKIIVLLSILSVAIFNSFTYIAMQTTLVINASLMGSIAPLFILFFSFIIFKNKTNVFQFFGIILSIIGVSFIVLKGDVNNLIYLNFTPGDLWMLIAVMAWALYSVLLKKLDIKLPLITTLSVMIFFGLIFIFPFYVYESFNYGFAPMSFLDLVMIFYVAIFAGIFSYLFWNKGVSIIGANRSGVFLHLIPFFSAIWAITFLNEAFAIYHIFGIIFIAIGILFANKKVNL